MSNNAQAATCTHSYLPCAFKARKEQIRGKKKEPKIATPKTPCTGLHSHGCREVAPFAAASCSAQTWLPDRRRYASERTATKLRTFLPTSGYQLAQAAFRPALGDGSTGPSLLPRMTRRLCVHFGDRHMSIYDMNRPLC